MVLDVRLDTTFEISKHAGKQEDVLDLLLTIRKSKQIQYKHFKIE